MVSIYALRDNSTFDDANLPKAKQFVDRDELLDVLRKNLHGMNIALYHAQLIYIFQYYGHSPCSLFIWIYNSLECPNRNCDKLDENYSRYYRTLIKSHRMIKLIQINPFFNLSYVHYN